MGMVASLGSNVEMNCAAARAGVVRSQVLEHFKSRSAVDGDAEPISAHVSDLYTRGFEGDVRLMRLAQGGLVDLLAHMTQTDWTKHRVRFYLSLPAEDRTTSESAETDGGAETRGLERAQRIARRAAALAHWPTPVEVAAAGVSGHTGALEALQRAVEDLHAGQVDTAVLLAVDSLVDVPVLKWLQAADRLKCDGVPDGLQPGEAAAAIALSGSAPSAGEARNATQVLSVHLSEEPRNLLAAIPARGEMLSSVVARAWQEATSSTAWVILDGNGEIFRAMDWGHALVRLRSIDEAFATPVVWYPAMSFGDTGAASALIGMCMAVRAWERGYAPGDSAIIASASDGQLRGAVALRHS